MKYTFLSIIIYPKITIEYIPRYRMSSESGYFQQS